MADNSARLGQYLHPAGGNPAFRTKAAAPKMRAKAMAPRAGAVMKSAMPPMNAMPPVGVGAPNPGAGVGVPTGASSPNFSQLFGFHKAAPKRRGMK